MTENSIEAFKLGKAQREKNKLLVFNALKKNPNSSRFCIGRITGLGDIEAQRRLSDLKAEGKVIVSGKRKHFKRNISLYSVKQQLELYPEEKKLTFEKWAKKYRPNWWNEYRTVIHHEL